MNDFDGILEIDRIFPEVKVVLSNEEYLKKLGRVVYTKFRDIVDPLTPLKLQEHFGCVVVANSPARKEKI